MDLLRNLFKGDKVIWIIFLLLCFVSIIEVFSASSTLTYKSGDHWRPIMMHMVLMAVGAVVVIIVHNIPCRWFKTFILLLPISWVLLGSVFIGQKIRMLQLIGMMISLSGCLFVIRVVTPDGLRLSQLHWSDLLIFGSAGSWALYVLWGRGTVRRVPSLVYTGWTLLSCTAAVGIYSLLDGQMLSLPRNSEGWWLLVWMILFPTIGAFWAWNQASGVLALPIQNISQYLIPVSAVVMAHFMLSEPLSAFQILGIFLITCGVAMDPAISARLRRRCGRFLHHVRSGRK